MEMSKLFPYNLLKCICSNFFFIVTKMYMRQFLLQSGILQALQFPVSSYSDILHTELALKNEPEQLQALYEGC